jgi:hypothetical protein
MLPTVLKIVNQLIIAHKHATFKRITILNKLKNIEAFSRLKLRNDKL